jgi:vacuolar-type H+-ATPase subunit E/Vma4
MATNDEKLSKFYLAINHYAEEQRRQIEEEVAEFKQKELDEAEDEVLNESYRLIQKEMAQMRNSIFQEMAQREVAGRRALLEQRQKITDEVFSRAAEQLRSFTKTDRYQTWLQNSAARMSAVFPKAGTVLRIREADAGYQKIIRESFGADCEFQTDRTIVLGGLRAYHAELGVMVDETLDSLLEDQRNWFEENSGMRVV